MLTKDYCAGCGKHLPKWQTMDSLQVPASQIVGRDDDGWTIISPVCAECFWIKEPKDA